MNSVPDRTGVVLSCDLNGNVLEVLFEQVSPCAPLQPGQHFAQFLSSSSIAKAQYFLKTLCGEGVVLEEQLEVALDTGSASWYFAGCRTKEQLVIIGAPTRLGVLRRNRFLLEQISALSADVFAVSHTRLSLQEIERSRYEELARITNEYAAMHRQLVQSNAMLERAQKTLAQQNAEIDDLNARLRRSMTETHHRVKNNLQIISAIIDLQRSTEADYVPMAELERLSHNVRALSVIHDVLTEEAKTDSNQKTISTQSVLEKLFSMLTQTLGPNQRLTYSVEETKLPGRKLTSLTLIANELFLNAMKHGRGEAEIGFRIHEGHATLQVGDNGPGLPEGFDPATAAHTGLALVNTLTRHDLGGQVRFANRPEGGAQIIVTFPLG